MRLAAFFSPTTSCLIGVNLSSIQCSGLFGCYNFSSVSCCKTHRLRLYPGLHHSCETLISGTHSPITALADACCLVGSPAGSGSSSDTLLAPLTTVELLSIWRQAAVISWVALHVLYLFPLLLNWKDCLGCLESALLWLCHIKPWIWNRLVHHIFCAWVCSSCLLCRAMCTPAKWFISTVFNNKIVL